jgi:hypothetical protein
MGASVFYLCALLKRTYPSIHSQAFPEGFQDFIAPS